MIVFSNIETVPYELNMIVFIHVLHIAVSQDSKGRYLFNQLW